VCKPGRLTQRFTPATLAKSSGDNAGAAAPSASQISEELQQCLEDQGVAGTRVRMHVVVVNGTQAGPVLVLTGAAHSNEVVGTGALIWTLKALDGTSRSAAPQGPRRQQREPRLDQRTVTIYRYCP